MWVSHKKLFGGVRRSKENFRCFIDLFKVYYAVLSDLLDDYDRDERNHRDSTAGGHFVFYIAITSKYC